MDSVLSPASAASGPGGPGGPGCGVSYSDGFASMNGGAAGSYVTYPAGSTNLAGTGWSCDGGSVDAINTPSAYSTGAFPANTTVIELGGSPVGNPATQGAGTLTRDFLIPCDSTVNFSFDWSNPSTHNATATLTRGSDLIPPFTLIAGRELESRTSTRCSSPSLCRLARSRPRSPEPGQTTAVPSSTTSC